MRIVQIVRSDSFAGVERYICDVSNGLQARGNEVTVVGGDGERMRAELSEAIAFRPAVSTLEAVLALASLREVDIVHAHMTAAETAAALVSITRSQRLVATRHFPDRRARSTLAGPVAFFIRRRLTSQLAISKFVANAIGEPSTLLYNGVRNRERAHVRRKAVVMLQRLEPEKSPEVGLRAWAASTLPHEGWTLEVAGDGSLKTYLQALCAELNIQDSVAFHGRVRDTDALLREVSAMIAPAPAEPFGLSVVEAMAHGIPVVAARGGGHVETAGEYGLQFAPGDHMSAARALETLAADLDVRREIGGRLRLRQQELFSIERHLAELEAIYQADLTPTVDT